MRRQREGGIEKKSASASRRVAAAARAEGRCVEQQEALAERGGERGEEEREE